MRTEADEIIIPVSADLGGLQSALDDLSKRSRDFGTVFSSSIRGAVASGKSFEDTLKSIALRLSNMALSAALKPLDKLAAGLFQQIGNALSGTVTPNAKGNVVTANGIVPFARGGVVASPTYFTTGNRMGVMGEAGAEAIMPLARGSDGRLGVRADGGGGTTHIVFNVSSPDVAGFRKSEGQIASMLTRAVGRGRRGL